MANLIDLSIVIDPAVVRRQLGVDDLDITNEQVKESGLYDELLLDLYDWFPNIVSLINDTSGSDAVEMQRIAVKSYGKYYLCHKLALSGRLSFFQKTGDGENADSRFNFSWDKSIADWEKQMASMKERTLSISTAFTPESTTSAGFAGMMISSPATDVVNQ